MIVYSVVMSGIAVMLSVFAILIIRGNTTLITRYREERVKGRAVYCSKRGKSFGS